MFFSGKITEIVISNLTLSILAVLTMLEEYITSMCIGKPQALRDFLLDLVVPR